MFLLFQPRRAVVAHATFFALFALFLPVVGAEWRNHSHSPASPDLTDFIDFLLHPPQTTTDLHDFFWAILLMAPLALLALLCRHALLHGALRAVLRRVGGGR